MERKIQKVFFDQSSHIYVLDNYDALYWYRDKIFYPFLSSLDHIKNCFRIGGTFFVHHGNTISQFDDNLVMSAYRELWITKSIDFVCYHEGLNIIATLEDGEIYLNFNVSVVDTGDASNNSVDRACLSRKYVEDGNEIYLKEYHKFDRIKIVDDFLFTFLRKIGRIEIFHLDNSSFEHVTSVVLDEEMYNEIYHYNPSYNMIRLKNGEFVSIFDGFVAIHPFSSATSDDPLFHKKNIYFVLKKLCLLCYYPQEKYDSIIKPLLDKLPIITNDTIKMSDTQSFTSCQLLSHTNIFILDNWISQLVVCDGKIYRTDNILEEIFLDNDSINYDILSTYSNDKSDTDIVIDVDTTKPVFNQLLNIIPHIYRLNSDKVYNFEQIDQFGTIISYGDGVTRHILSTLSKELDEILKNRFGNYTIADAFSLGKILYFCSIDGGEKFYNIHPYFFYLMSTETDFSTLLKKFKGKDYPLLYKQYLEYYANPKSLIDLGLDIETSNDYIKYLLTSDLDQNQMEFYRSLVRGFHYFLYRSRFYHLIKKMPITYFTNLLIAQEYFGAVIIYSTETDSVNNFQFFIFKKIFNKLFAELSTKEKLIFTQNVTGSQYYNGEINVIMSYYEGDNILTLETDLLGTDNDETEEMDEIIRNIQAETFSESKLAYRISTCNSELIVKVRPNEENLKNIISMLVVEDLTMIN